ncbi:MAG: DNA repair protein RadC [Bacteroidales bacterium]|nr:DNA repair protein RadC [Bacteroidales bacterium]
MEKYTQKSPIRAWAESDRPREKLLLKGKTALSDAELVAILIGSGNQDESAVDLSRRILGSINHSLIELSKLSIIDLQKFKGIGEAKAISIIAALELGRRRRGAEATDRKSISSSKQAFEILHPHLSDLHYEQFAIILLNRASHFIKVVNVSEGGVSGTVVDPKKVFKLAIENNASSIILAHNHPSGNINPSDQDIMLTKKLKKAGDYIDISVLDHIIVGGENYYSFADSGTMPGKTVID